LDCYRKKTFTKEGGGHLYLLTKSNNDIKLKHYYKLYCKILNKVIKKAKRSNYNKRNLTSPNKLKTAWVIVKYETGQGKDIAKINNHENDSEYLLTTF
jgi:hypothetical protein